MLKWIRGWFNALKRESTIPPPTFRASKRTWKIMGGLWYGRLTPEEARTKARDSGFPEEEIERMISEATQPPSYWSRKNPEA